MSQITKLLKFLTKTTEYPGKLTRKQALSMGVQRLPARIYDIRNLGFTVHTNTKTTKKGETVTVYRLSPSDVNVAKHYI